MPRTSATRNCSERSWRKLRSGPCGPTASFLIRNSTPIATRTAPPGNSPGEGGSAGEERTGVRTLAVPHLTRARVEDMALQALLYPDRADHVPKMLLGIVENVLTHGVRQGVGRLIFDRDAHHCAAPLLSCGVVTALSLKIPSTWFPHTP